jgi:hypothetical protein
LRPEVNAAPNSKHVKVADSRFIFFTVGMFKMKNPGGGYAD